MIQRDISLMENITLWNNFSSKIITAYIELFPLISTIFPQNDFRITMTGLNEWLLYTQISNLIKKLNLAQR